MCRIFFSYVCTMKPFQRHGMLDYIYLPYKGVMLVNIRGKLKYYLPLEERFEI